MKKVRGGVVGVLAVMVAAAAPGLCAAKVKFTRMGSIPGTGGVVTGVARTHDGRLHLIFPTSDSGSNGLSARSSNLSGVFGLPKPALSTEWGVSAPGLLALPGGSLEAFFGAIAPVAPHPDGTWGITSTDGGSTWSSPGIVSSGGPLESQAYGAAVTAQLAGSLPVLTLNVSGTLVVQRGLGPGSPVQRVDTQTDGFPVEVNSATDAATGQVIASWNSLAANTGGLYMQAVAPALGTAQHLPGNGRSMLTIAGRDQGAGVFGAYTTDDKHVRLARYGGGTVAVGSLASVSPGVMGVATGVDGRIWVMWGSDSGQIAVTRSNKAVTKFEPIQTLSAKIVTLFRLYGDGRPGILDLLVDELPDDAHAVAGVYQVGLRPDLSANVSIKSITKKKKVTAHALTVTVTDAGDAVKGATVFVKGKTKQTNPQGVAKLTLPGASTGKVDVTVTAPTYNKLFKKISL